MKEPPRRRRKEVATAAESIAEDSGPIAAIRLEHFLREMPVLLDAFDAHGRLVFWNRECERVTGYGSREMVGNPDALRLLYPDPVYLADLLANCASRGPAQVWCLRAKNGETRSIAWTNVPADPTGPSQWEWGFGLDLTERIRLTAALDEAAERERHRLGQELHDGLGQTLTGLSLLAQSLSKRPEIRHHSVAADLEQLARFASGAVQTCREIASGLMPTEETGLCAALRNLVHDLQLQASNVRITFENRSHVELRVSSVTHGHLYRMVQEALNNAIRHSGGDRIRLVCRATPELVTLLVQDNGRGIPASSKIQRGLGMRSLHDRAAAVNARLLVESLPRGGTQVRVECPNHGVSSAV